MLPSESRQFRPERRARRRTNLADLELLESRALMAFSTLGFSLPDLQITGTAGPVAAWGGTLSVTATIVNSGASTITNPIAQAPGSPSTADAAASQVTVLLTPRAHSLRGAVTLGTFTAPAIPQNNLEQVTASFTLPSRPRGFTGRAGGTFYLRLEANSNNQLVEADGTDSDISPPIPVTLASQALPELQAVALGVPPVLQPGDTIAPTIGVANLGTAASGPVQVALVASTTRNFTVGSSIVALYNIANIPSASQTPVGGNAGPPLENVSPPGNTVFFTGPAVTLPTSPQKYFLGVVVDPFGKVKQLTASSSRLSLIQTVGPPIPNLPPAGVVSTPSTNLFPLPPTGTLIGVLSTSSTSSSTIVNS